MVGRGQKRLSGERLRVAVLMGGPSNEHEVSLEGGRRVVDALDANVYEVRPVVITREGHWRIPEGRKLTAAVSAVSRSADRPDDPEATIAPKGFDPHDSDAWTELPDPCEALLKLRNRGTDVVLPILHGAFGEDGVLQACLNAAGIPYVGSGHRASAIAFDKVRTKEILGFHGIPTPAFRVVRAKDLTRRRAMLIDEWIDEFGLPLVLKNPCGGSSVDVRIAKDAGEITVMLDELAPPAERILVEAFVPGRELTAGVLEDREGEAHALPIVEIRMKSAAFFDYFEKYNADGATELVPAPIDPEVESAARALGLRVHELLGLRGVSRTDIRMAADGTLYVLEVNTMPGMTDRGLVPQAARAEGIDFSTLIDGLVRTARSA